jgi:hypothetical protein
VTATGTASPTSTSNADGERHPDADEHRWTQQHRDEHGYGDPNAQRDTELHANHCAYRVTDPGRDPNSGGPRWSSLGLDGTTAYAEAPPADELNLTGSWTVELWFKDQNPAGYNHPRTRLLTKGDTSLPEVPYFLGVEQGGLFVGLRAGGVPYALRYDLIANGIAPNQWHHVAASLDGASRVLTLYLDGRLVDRTTLPRLSAGNREPLNIGRSGALSGNYWKGLIDDVRIWNVVRTPEQVALRYHIELNSPPPGLVGNWRFDEGHGAVAADNTGLAENATIVGEAAWVANTPQF